MEPSSFFGGIGRALSNPIYRRYFDPKKWRMILFDQRGCGRSRPFAELPVQLIL